jgi:hypothetical protein
MSELLCPYCGNVARLTAGEEIYPHRADLHSRHFWACMPCCAWVGCHPGTKRPLGRLANAELRRLKQAAHAAFDPLWQRKIVRDRCSKGEARTAGYLWLAKRMGIHPDNCHIGQFDEARCKAVIEICGGGHV